MKKSSTGLDENLAGLLAYSLGWLSGLVIYLVERENQTVRFHAMQSILVFGALTAVSFFPFVGLFTAPIGFVLWIFLMIKAYNGDRCKLPLAGDIAENLVLDSQNTSSDEDQA